MFLEIVNHKQIYFVVNVMCGVQCMISFVLHVMWRHHETTQQEGFSKERQYEALQASATTLVSRR